MRELIAGIDKYSGESYRGDVTQGGGDGVRPSLARKAFNTSRVTESQLMSILERGHTHAEALW